MNENEIGIHIAVIKDTEKEAKALCKMIADTYEIDIQYVTLTMLVDDMDDSQYQLEVSMKKLDGKT